MKGDGERKLEEEIGVNITNRYLLDMLKDMVSQGVFEICEIGFKNNSYNHLSG